MNKKEFEAPTPDETMFDHGAEPAEENYTPTLIEETYGTVTNCERLNIRSEPRKKNSEVLCVVDKGSRLLIDKSKSTIMWYAVTTESGVEGYVMKEYVTV